MIDALYVQRHDLPIHLPAGRFAPSSLRCFAQDCVAGDPECLRFDALAIQIASGKQEWRLRV
jgi:hypothetical protein